LFALLISQAKLLLAGATYTRHENCMQIQKRYGRKSRETGARRPKKETTFYRAMLSESEAAPELWN